MLCIVFKVPPNLIGSQYEKLIIQKLNVTLDIISDYHGHTSLSVDFWGRIWYNHSE